MPSSTPERQARWGSDGAASDYLAARGFRLRRDWCWVLPEGRDDADETEADAIIYLIEEWDYGGMVRETAGLALMI